MKPTLAVAEIQGIELLTFNLKLYTYLKHSSFHSPRFLIHIKFFYIPKTHENRPLGVIFQNKTTREKKRKNLKNS